MIIADQVAPIADAAFARPAEQLTTATAWIGALAYTVQIYFDFSGYSDMAIGLGQMFGFRLPENFNRPYSANSITDFWRRWHMSLSRWFRDYVYIPLGGNRKGRPRDLPQPVDHLPADRPLARRGLDVHRLGRSITASLMVIERLTGIGTRDPKSIAENVVRRAVTMLLVVVGWVFFRAIDIGQAGSFLKTMFTWVPGPRSDALIAATTNQSMVMLAVGLLVVLMPARLVMGRFIEDYLSKPALVFRLAVLFVFAALRGDPGGGRHVQSVPLLPVLGWARWVSTLPTALPPAATTGRRGRRRPRTPSCR